MNQIRFALLIVSCALLVCSAHSVSGATDATVVGPDLKPRQISVQSLRDDVLSYFDEHRRYTTDRIDRFLQLREFETDRWFSDTAEPSTDEQSSMVILTDGQQLVGHWLPNAQDADDQTIAWQHDILGTVRVPLQNIKSIQTTTGRRASFTADAQVGDQVRLSNGDIVRGFVLAVNDKGVNVQLPGQEQTVTLAYDAIAAMHLANPPADESSTGHLVWLSKSGRIRAAQIQIVDGKVVMKGISLSPDATAAAPLSKVQRIDFALQELRLIDLATLPMSVESGGAVFGNPMQPYANGSDLHLHAPVRVVFELPIGTQRLAAEAALDVGRDSASAGWADFDVLIDVDGEVISRIHIDSERRRVELNLPVNGARLGITLIDGRNGPVMDRLLLHNAILLVR